MDPGVVLNRGRDSCRAGRYREALEDYIWFHEHALEHDRSYYGVRLSFALLDWRDLAEVYRPAMKALASVRARAAAALRTGAGDRALFHDLASIDRALGKVRDTHALFRLLWRRQPGLAMQCRDLAVEAVVEAGDFELASRCLPHPETYVLWLSDRLNEALEAKALPRRAAAVRREAYVRNYCTDVETGIRILRGLENHAAARAFREWAIALVGSRGARNQVLERLAPR